MSFLRKFTERLLGFNHVVFPKKKRELKSVMSLLRMFRNRVVGLYHVVSSEKNEN